MTPRHGGAAKLLLAAVPLLALAIAQGVQAGVLVLGQPTIENGQYTFPISLNGADNQISSLDFRIQFDPQVFQPVSAAAGNAALAGNKMVTANYANPGEYAVVMMGLNQSVVPGGQVASVVMQRVGGDAGAKTQLSITDPTLATPDGTEIPASGSSLGLSADGSKPEPPKRLAFSSCENLVLALDCAVVLSVIVTNKMSSML